MATRHWVYDMYEDADSLDPERAMKWLTPDVTQRMGNNPPTVGIAQAREGYEHMLGAMSSMKHDFIEIWDTESGVAIAEALVTYHRKVGGSVTLPATTILRHRDGKVYDLRIYMDPSLLSAS